MGHADLAIDFTFNRGPRFYRRSDRLRELLATAYGAEWTSQKEKEFCYSSFPEGLELAPSRNRGLPVGHGASALATLLISSIVDEV